MDDVRHQAPVSTAVVTPPEAPAAAGDGPRGELDLLPRWFDSERLLRGALVHRFGTDQDDRWTGSFAGHGWGGTDEVEKLAGRMSAGPASTVRLPVVGSAAQWAALRMRGKGATRVDLYHRHARIARVVLRGGRATTVSVPLDTSDRAGGASVVQWVPNALVHFPNRPDERPAFVLESFAVGANEADVRAALDDATVAPAGVLAPGEGRSWVFAAPAAGAELQLAASTTCDRDDVALRAQRDADDIVPRTREIAVRRVRTESQWILGLDAGAAARLTLHNPHRSCAVRVEALSLRWARATVLPFPIPADGIRSAIVVLVDTLRVDRTIAAPAEKRPPTPAHDDLARHGVTFANARSTSNWTLPAVASLLTGTWPQTHGVTRRDRGVDEQVPLLSEALRAKDVQTAAFAVNGFVSKGYGLDRGWDSFRNYTVDAKPNEPDTKAPRVFADALAWLDAHGDRPFFLYLHTFDPHAPYEPAQPFFADGAAVAATPRVGRVVTAGELERIRRGGVSLDAGDRRRLVALYDGEVVEHDRAWAVFVDALAARGLLDRCLLVFVSDHGEELDDHGSWGHEHTTYEELLRVPILIGGGTTAAPRAIVRTDPVSLVDLHATLSATFGLARDAHQVGRSLFDAPPPEEDVFPRVLHAVASDGQEITHVGRYKEVVTPGLAEGLESLQDLGTDPREQHEGVEPLRPIAADFVWLSRARATPPTPPATRRSDTRAPDPHLDQKLRALGYAQ